MSRKRKRRERDLGSTVGTVQEHDKDHDIEIVDDVNLLGDQVTAAGETPDTVRAAGLVAPVSTSTESSSTSADGHSASVEVPSQPAISSVHEVESLHESPQAAPEGDRNVETLGELLQHAREAKGLSLEEVSARTRIALLTLRHLENDRFGELPAEAYVKGFLRSYGSFLSLDVSMLLRRYEKLSGHVSAPVAEIWDEVDVGRSRMHVWRPSRRTVAIVGAALVVAALAWVFWSQGAVMLGLRPAGELQKIEMQLEREAQEGETPRTPITGLDDAALQQEPDKATGSAVGATAPTQAAGTSKSAATQDVQISTVEDAAPPVPQPPVKPVTATKPQATQQGTATADSPSQQPAAPPVNPAAAAAKKPVLKPAPQPAKAPVKKAAPAPSPEDAAGPPG